MLALTVVSAMVVVMVAGVMWSGFVLSILWGWFFVPSLGVPALSVPSAIGIALVVSYMTHQYQKKNKTEIDGWEAVAESMAHMALKPVFALAIGWIVKQWV